MARKKRASISSRKGKSKRKQSTEEVSSDPDIEEDEVICEKVVPTSEDRDIVIITDSITDTVQDAINGPTVTNCPELFCMEQSSESSGTSDIEMPVLDSPIAGTSCNNIVRLLNDSELPEQVADDCVIILSSDDSNDSVTGKSLGSVYNTFLPPPILDEAISEDLLPQCTSEAKKVILPEFRCRYTVAKQQIIENEDKKSENEEIVPINTVADDVKTRTRLLELESNIGTSAAAEVSLSDVVASVDKVKIIDETDPEVSESVNETKCVSERSNVKSDNYFSEEQFQQLRKTVTVMMQNVNVENANVQLNTTPVTKKEETGSSEFDKDSTSLKLGSRSCSLSSNDELCTTESESSNSSLNSTTRRSSRIKDRRSRGLFALTETSVYLVKKRSVSYMEQKETKKQEVTENKNNVVIEDKKDEVIINKNEVREEINEILEDKNKQITEDKDEITDSNKINEEKKTEVIEDEKNKIIADRDNEVIQDKENDVWTIEDTNREVIQVKKEYTEDSNDLVDDTNIVAIEIGKCEVKEDTKIEVQEDTEIEVEEEVSNKAEANRVESATKSKTDVVIEMQDAWTIEEGDDMIIEESNMDMWKAMRNNVSEQTKKDNTTIELRNVTKVGTVVDKNEAVVRSKMDEIITEKCIQEADIAKPNESQGLLQTKKIDLTEIKANQDRQRFRNVEITIIDSNKLAKVKEIIEENVIEVKTSLNQDEELLKKVKSVATEVKSYEKKRRRSVEKKEFFKEDKCHPNDPRSMRKKSRWSDREESVEIKDIIESRIEQDMKRIIGTENKIEQFQHDDPRKTAEKVESSLQEDSKVETNKIHQPVKVKSRWRRSCEFEATSTSESDASMPQTSSSLQLLPVESSISVTAVPQTTVSRKGNTTPPRKESTIMKKDSPGSIPGLTLVKKDSQKEKEVTSPVNEEAIAEKLRTFAPIDENIYLTARHRNKEVRRMVCDCFLTKDDITRGEVGCGEDCLNRLLMIECGSRCPLGERCTNRHFQQRTYCNYEVFKTEKKGFGIRANKDVECGDFLLEYMGEVLGPKEFRRRAKEYSRDKYPHYYFMALKADAIIDATQKGNSSRFINHSCDPNAETQKWTVNGELRIGFFANKFIASGEEITFDYQLQRYGKEAQRCYCGSANCRGWIGEDPEEETEEITDDYDEAEDEWNEEEEINDKEEVVETKDMKERMEKKTKKEDNKDDIYLEKEIEKLSITGVKNRKHTLTVCRLMVRAQDSVSRLAILQLLRTGDQACRRLFLDYHGLRLLWSWMTDIRNGPDGAELKMEILQTLASVPVSNKTILQDSKVLAVVEKWANGVAEENSPLINQPNDTSPAESTESSISPEQDKIADKMSPKMTDISPIQYDSPEETKEDKHFTDDSMDVDSPTDTKDNSLIVIANDSTGESSEAKKVIDDSVELEVDKKVAVEAEKKADNDVVSDLLQLYQECITFAGNLIQSWSHLQEVFRIPKKERIEQMKEHEREADKEHTEADDENRRFGQKFISEYERRGDRKRRSDSPDRGWRKLCRLDDNRCNIVNVPYGGNEATPREEPRRVLLPLPRISKEERRHLFELQVLHEEEEARQKREQEDEYREHEKRCTMLGIPADQTPLFNCNYIYHFNYTTRTWDPRVAKDGSSMPFDPPQDDPNNPMAGTLPPYNPSKPGGGMITVQQPDGSMADMTVEEYVYLLSDAYARDEVYRQQCLEAYNLLYPHQSYPENGNSMMQYQQPPLPSEPPPPLPPPEVSGTISPENIPLPPGPNLTEMQKLLQMYARQENIPLPPEPCVPQMPNYNQIDLQSLPLPSEVPPIPQQPPLPVQPPLPIQPPLPVQPPLPPVLPVGIRLPYTMVAPFPLPVPPPRETMELPSSTVDTSVNMDLDWPEVSTTTIDCLPPPPPPKPVYTTLPIEWRWAKDNGGRVYYYHIKERVPQWEAPPVPAFLEEEEGSEESSEDEDEDAANKENGGEESDEEEALDDEELEDGEIREEVVYKKKLEVVAQRKARRRDEKRARHERHVMNGLVEHRIISPRTEEEKVEMSKFKEMKAMIKQRRLERKKIKRATTSQFIALEAEQRLQEKHHRLIGKELLALEEDQCEEDEPTIEPVAPPPPIPEEVPKPVEIKKLVKEVSKKDKSSHKKRIKSSKLKKQKDELKKKIEKPTSAAADTSSDMSRKIKDAFRTGMAGWIVQCLNPYRKPDCKEAKISSTDDFKHLARKLTHFVMLKEIKHCHSIEDLQCTESVKHKARDFIRKYMKKYGELYQRDPTDDSFE